MINYFISFLLRMLKDQRGEAGPDLDVEEPGADDEPGEEEPPDDDDVILDLGDEPEPGEDEPEEPGDKPEDKPDADDLSSKLEKLETDITDRTKKMADLDVAITEANRKLHGIRQEKGAEKKGEGEEDATFTKAQLVQILEEHKDEPEVMLRIVEQKVKQAVKGVKDETINATEVAAKSKEFNDVLNERYPELKDAGSALRAEVDGSKAILGMEDHPYGDYIGMAGLVLNQLPNLIKQAHEAGKQEALKDKGDKHRKAAIKSSSLSSPGKIKTGTEATVTEDMAAVEKMLGLKTPAQKKLYRQLVAKQKVLTVEV